VATTCFRTDKPNLAHFPHTVSFKIPPKTVSFKSTKSVKLIDHPHFVPFNSCQMKAITLSSLWHLQCQFMFSIFWPFSSVLHTGTRNYNMLTTFKKPSGFSKRNIFWTEQRERGELRCWHGPSVCFPAPIPSAVRRFHMGTIWLSECAVILHSRFSWKTLPAGRIGIMHANRNTVFYTHSRFQI